MERESPSSEHLILSTGDFDSVEVVEEILELKQRVPVIDVAGNHDHALLKDFPITSGTLEENPKSFSELSKEVHENKKVRDYFEQIVTNPVREFSVGNIDGVLVHGGLAGKIHEFEIEEVMRPFWYRLWDDEDLKLISI